MVTPGYCTTRGLYRVDPRGRPTLGGGPGIRRSVDERRAITDAADTSARAEIARIQKEKDELEASLRAQHLSEEHIAQIMRTVFGTP